WLQPVKELAVEAKGEEATRPCNLLEHGAHFDEPERQLRLVAIGSLLEIKDRTEESPFHVHVGPALAVPESILAVKVVAAQDVDVAAESHVVPLGRVSIPAA